MSWPKTPEHGHAKLGDKPAAAEGSIMTNQQEAPKSTALDGKTELFHVLGHPLLVRAVDFNRLYAEKERLAALVEAQQPAQAADSVLEDAARWQTFIALPYATRAEWASNLSLAPVLTQWVDAARKQGANHD